MKDQIQTLLGRAWTEFKAFSPGQKTVAIAAALALIIGGYFFTTYQATPAYAPLYTNLAASDASAIVDKLNSAGVPYQLGQAGTEILVPQDKVYSTRLTVSAAGLPSSTQTGYSLLDKEGVTTSEFKQQIDYQRAIEGELAKTIQSMSGVQSASVHLAIPQQDVFNDGSQKPTAAVLLGTASGLQLTPAQVQSIVYLVSSSVPNLAADAVTVTDSNGQLLASPGNGIGGVAGNDARSQATQGYNAEMAAKLQSLIDPVVGPGHAQVSVNAVLDFSKKSTTTKRYIYDPKAPPLSEQKTSEKYTGAAANGAGGTLGAGTAATNTTASSGGTYDKTGDTRDNALGTQTEVVDNAPGDVSKMSVGVLIDGSVKGLALAKVTSLLSAAAGITPSRGDTLSIQAMAFDKSAAAAAAASAKSAAAAAAAKASKEQMTSLIKQGALGAVLLAVLVGTWLASRKRRRQGPPPALVEYLDEPLPVAPAPDPRNVAAAAEYQENAARRRALVSLAEEQPEDVASVLSNWLNSNGDRNDHAKSAWTPGLADAGRTN